MRVSEHQSDPLSDLVANWRDRAESGEAERAMVDRASVYRRVADELERAREKRAQPLLSVEQAAAESGYSETHIRRLLRNATLPNAGQKHTPRVRRADLPRKPGSGARPVSAKGNGDLPSGRGSAAPS